MNERERAAIIEATRENMAAGMHTRAAIDYAIVEIFPDDDYRVPLFGWRHYYDELTTEAEKIWADYLDSLEVTYDT